MYNLIIFLFSGFTTFATYFTLKQTLNNKKILTTNYRGIEITPLGGIYFLVSLLISVLFIYILDDLTNEGIEVSQIFVVIVLGFAFLGFVDDLIGDKSSQGFKGHIKSLLKGKLTTGGLKLFGGPIICLIALMPYESGIGYEKIILSVLIISLFANFINLLDLAPGRSSKYALVILVISAIVSSTSAYRFALIGILLVLLVFDLNEKFMLGDVGSNAIGAAVGFTLVDASDTLLQMYILLIVVLILNILSEFVSFSKIINAVLPLRLFDLLGQSEERRKWLKDKSKN